MPDTNTEIRRRDGHAGEGRWPQPAEVHAEVRRERRTLRTDGWSAYRAVAQAGYRRQPVVTGSGAHAIATFPWLHAFIGNMKRMILGTYHRVCAKHLGNYLAEFGYRTNRRWVETTLFDCLLQAATCHKAVTYRQLVTGGS